MDYSQPAQETKVKINYRLDVCDKINQREKRRPLLVSVIRRTTCRPATILADL